MSQLKKLRTVYLGKNEIQKGVAVLVKALASPKLSHVDLTSNHIGDQGVAILVEALSQLSQSIYLKLEQNPIREEGKGLLKQYALERGEVSF